MAERFFGSVQGERTALRHDATRQEARDDVVAYLEMFYNSKRLHSYVGYVSPHDFERLGRVASLTVRFYLTITVEGLLKPGDIVVVTGNEMLQDQMAVVTKPTLRN